MEVEVWRRDRGQCVQCGSMKNLHFDPGIPFSKGGSSLTAANVRMLCARCNLQNGADGLSDTEGKIARGSDEGVWKRASFKSDKILSVAPWFFAGATAAQYVRNLSG